jgi:hypothetical protein
MREYTEGINEVNSLRTREDRHSDEGGHRTGARLHRISETFLAVFLFILKSGGGH